MVLVRFGCGKAGGGDFAAASATPSSPLIHETPPQHISTKVVAWALRAPSVALANYHGAVNHVCEGLMILLVEQGCLGEVRNFVGVDGARKPLWRQSILETNLSLSPHCASRMDAELTKQREPRNTVFPERLQSKGLNLHPLLRILWIYDVSTVWAPAHSSLMGCN